MWTLPAVLRWLALAVTVLAVGGAVWSVDGLSGTLEPTQRLPLDVEVAATDVWRQFLLVFGNRQRCMGDVSLTLERSIVGDARCRLAEREIIIQIPTSPVRFGESLVHELGHHMERTCGIESVETTFLAAQGFAPGTAWFGPAEWEQTPSEHFAEAVVQIVLGDRLLHDDDVPLSSAAIDLVRLYGEA